MERVSFKKMPQRIGSNAAIDWSASMDMALDMRAVRSIYMHELDATEVTQIQDHERKYSQKQGVDFAPRFMMLSEMSKMLNGHVSSFRFRMDQVSSLISWVMPSKPNLQGMEKFNGLDFHHQWDWNSRNLVLPVFKGVQRISEAI
jgi:hypothetical protein